MNRFLRFLRNHPVEIWVGLSALGLLFACFFKSDWSFSSNWWWVGLFALSLIAAIITVAGVWIATFRGIGRGIGWTFTQLGRGIGWLATNLGEGIVWLVTQLGQGTSWLITRFFRFMFSGLIQFFLISGGMLFVTSITMMEYLGHRHEGAIYTGVAGVLAIVVGLVLAVGSVIPATPRPQQPQAPRRRRQGER